MNSIPREGISKESIACYDLNRTYHSDETGGPDFSALIQIPNELNSLRNYFSQVSVIDKGVGNVISALETEGFADNTIVIFTSDHGFSLGHHGFWGHGQATWPANAYRIAYNIPLLFWGPGHISPAQDKAPYVSSMDLYATLLGYLGLSTEIDKAHLPSRDFSHLLRGQEGQWSNEVFIEQEETRAYRTTGWSYVKRFHGSQLYPLIDELYNTSEDPDERTNLSGSTDYKEIENLFSKKLDIFFAKYADPKYDTWTGGTVKSNTSRPWLWRDAWGADWSPSL